MNGGRSPTLRDALSPMDGHFPVQVYAAQTVHFSVGELLTLTRYTRRCNSTEGHYVRRLFRVNDEGQPCNKDELLGIG